MEYGEKNQLGNPDKGDHKGDARSKSPYNDGGPPPPSYNQATGLNIAMNSDFISHQPMTLRMQGHTFSRDFEVFDGSGQQIFNVDASSFSFSHEMTVIHSPSGQSMFTITKKTFSMSWRYSAEMPAGSGNMLFETETSPGFFSSGTTYMNFRNAMNNGERESLEIELHTYTGPSIVKHRGSKIAEIHRTSFSMSPEYNINVHAGGVDPLILIVLTLVINDRIQTKKRNN